MTLFVNPVPVCRVAAGGHEGGPPTIGVGAVFRVAERLLGASWRPGRPSVSVRCRRRPDDGERDTSSVLPRRVRLTVELATRGCGPVVVCSDNVAWRRRMSSVTAGRKRVPIRKADHLAADGRPVRWSASPRRRWTDRRTSLTRRPFATRAGRDDRARGVRLASGDRHLVVVDADEGGAVGGLDDEAEVRRVGRAERQAAPPDAVGRSADEVDRLPAASTRSRRRCRSPTPSRRCRRPRRRCRRRRRSNVTSPPRLAATPLMAGAAGRRGVGGRRSSRRTAGGRAVVDAGAAPWCRRRWRTRCWAGVTTRFVEPPLSSPK